jgi:hypothetical protein
VRHEHPKQNHTGRIIWALLVKARPAQYRLRYGE